MVNDAPFASTPSNKILLVLPSAHSREVIVPSNKLAIGIENTQDFPPNVTEKLATPEVAGVPDMLRITELSPVLRIPLANVAVSPVTPVELIV